MTVATLKLQISQYQLVTVGQPGFPCSSLFRFASSLDIPVFPTITATVTFQEFRYDEFDESIFTIPEDYKEDPSRFPDL